MWLLLPTGGLKSNWLVRKTSFIKEPATFSHETCEQCFINPEFFSCASCIQHIRKTASPSRVFTWTSVIYFFFVGGRLCPSWYTYALEAGFRSVSVINFPIFVCIPLLIDLRWNSSSSVSNSWLNTFPTLKKNHQPVPDKMEYASVATVTRCRRSPMEKHQLQMATNTDLNPGRLLPAVKDGTEFSAGPKNGSY